MTVDVLTSVFMTCGASAVDARRAAVRMGRNVAPAVHVKGLSEKQSFMEIFGRGSIIDMANRKRRDINVTGLDALDMRTLKTNGVPWFFSLKADRAEAMRLVEECNPTW